MNDPLAARCGCAGVNEGAGTVSGRGDWIPITSQCISVSGGGGAGSGTIARCGCAGVNEGAGTVFVKDNWNSDISWGGMSRIFVSYAAFSFIVELSFVGSNRWLLWFEMRIPETCC